MHKRQHGFRDGHSCESQLLGFTQDIADTIDRREQIDGIVIDFAKAFDVVPHDILMEKIYGMKIDKRVAEWVGLFLNKRTQRVKVGESLSEEISVTSGIPQGSVLGPLLFLVYINDLPDKIHSEIRLFADDCFVYKKIDSVEDCENLQIDLNEISRWVDANGMKLNSDKSKMMRFTNKKCKILYDYTLDNEVIETSSNCKYLGVTVDSHLKWNEHVSLMVGKAFRKLHLVMRVLRGCTNTVKEKGYLTFVRPSVEYCSSVWGSSNKGSMLKVDMVQRKAARYVCNDFRRTSSVSEMLNNLKWCKLEDRRKKNRLNIMYKIYKGEPAWEDLWRRLDAADYVGGRHDHTCKVRIGHSNTSVGKRSFLNTVKREWNMLPKSTLDPFPSSGKLFKGRLEENK
jgi:ribonucleases P/MRP protein subunit RPP40